MAKRALHPREQQAIQTHRNKREAEKEASNAKYAIGEPVLFLNAENPPVRYPGVVRNVAPSMFGDVFTVELVDRGTTVKTTAQRLLRVKGKGEERKDGAK